MTKRTKFLFASLLILLLAGFLAPSDALAAPLLAAVRRTIDGAAGQGVGYGTSVQLDAYQRPVIAYTDLAGTALKLAYCNDPVCSTWVTNKVDDADTGSHPSLQLSAAGLPVISYERGGLLYVAFCGTPACEPGTTTIKTLDARAGMTAPYTSMQLDASGRPIVSYSRPASSGFGGMWVAYCNDVDCDSVSLKQLESGAATSYTSMQLNSSGNPVIAYSSGASSRGAALIVCTAPDCSTFDPVVPLHAASQTGQYISLQLDAADRPRAVYFWNSGGIRIALCGDAACSSLTTVSFSGTGTTSYTSLALDASGRPVFTSATPDNSVLSLTRCSNATCGSSTTSTLDSVRTLRSSLVLDCANNPVVSYHNNSFSPTTNYLRLYIDNASACAASAVPQFKSSLAAPGPLEFSGVTGSSPQLSIDIRNGVYLTDLDVDVASITPGYSIVSGLPIDDLSSEDAAATITVQCDSLPQPAGTLVLNTNDASQPTVTYNLSCLAPSVGGSGGAASGSDITAAAATALAPSRATSLQLGRLRVSLPAEAIPPGQTGCELTLAQLGGSAAYGFTLDDAVFDVKVNCDSGELSIFLAPLTICIQPADGISNNKLVYHSHNGGSFQAMNSGVAQSGYVCGQTRLLSLFTLGQLALPDTGFAPGRIHTLPPQAAEQAYAAANLGLSIPKLGVELSIVGVPQGINGWDVSWLSSGQAGYLYGTSFPTWQGNSVLTAHVWNADNTPGPFYALKSLQHGDRFSVSAYGNTYVYEVRSNQLVLPSSLAALRSSDYSLITLITCESFNQASDSYLYRRAVQAVLVQVN